MYSRSSNRGYTSRNYSRYNNFRSPYGKKKYSGNKNYTGGSGYWGMAKKALDIATGVAKLVNTEKKAIDKGQTALSVYNVGWGIDPLTTVAQGDDYNQRNGRSIKVSDVDIRGIIKVNTGNKPCTLRYMLISDNASDGVVLDMTEVTNTAAGSDPAVYTFRNIATASVARYTVLEDKFIDISPNENQQVSFRVHKNLDHHVKYVGTTAAQTSTGAGTLYFCYIATGGTAADGCLFEYQARTRFIDN